MKLWSFFFFEWAKKPKTHLAAHRERLQGSRLMVIGCSFSAAAWVCDYAEKDRCRPREILFPPRPCKDHRTVHFSLSSLHFLAALPAPLHLSQSLFATLAFTADAAGICLQKNPSNLTFCLMIYFFSVSLLHQVSRRLPGNPLWPVPAQDGLRPVWPQ